MIAQDVSAEWAGRGAIAPSKERRRLCRHYQRLPLTLSVFNQDANFNAQMVNYSLDGACAETRQYLLPGMSLYLRIDANHAAAEESGFCHCFRTTALGEVKWCRALGQDRPQRYLIGIRYYSLY
jgi:hypothetical protein